MLGKGVVVLGFKSASAVRTVWMQTVHAWAHKWCARATRRNASSRTRARQQQQQRHATRRCSPVARLHNSAQKVATAARVRALSARAPFRAARRFPKTSAYLDSLPNDVYDFTSYQFRSYFRVHLAHFLLSPLLGGLCIHLHNGLPFIDAWFSSLAAMTGGSLMPYDVSRLDRFGEFVLWILMVVGGVTIMCLPPALNRIYIFRRKLRPLLQEAVALTEEVRDLAVEAGAGGADKLNEDIKDFHEMYEEYKLKDEAQEVIAVTVGVYTGVWHFFGAALIYATLTSKGTIPEYAARGISDAWFSIFMIASCLNNVGLSLLDDSMMPVADRPAPLMIMAFAMIFGNTAWPIALRAILWTLHKMFPRHRGIKYALEHPQDSCPSLFSDAQTLGLVAAVLVTNIFQVAMFMACSLELVRDGRSTLTMLYLAFFQCANSRSSGLQVFDLKRISKNMLVIYGFMMWYAPTPLVGIIGGEEFNMAFHNNPVLSGFIKKYTNRHTSWLFVVFVIISTAEQKLLADSGNWPTGDKPFTTLFNILFEMLSAYGTNGLSMGFPGVNHSLSGMFRPVSKLSIMFLMIMGRHRSMQGKSDPTLMQSLKRLTLHCDLLREQKASLGPPVAAQRAASTASLTGLEMAALREGADEGEGAPLVTAAAPMGAA